MQCARRRWGPGTTCEKQPDSPASKELQDRLAQMKAERTNQDGMWNEPVTTVKQVQTQHQTIQKTTPSNTGLLNYASYAK
jgi:hypothetical protein